MAVLLLTACEAPKELGVVPYPQYAQTTSKTVELPSTVTFSTNLAKSDMNDLLAYLPDFAIPRNKNRACLDADKVVLPLTVRKWRQGDKFVPFGMKGKKKVSDYLTDRKFSLFQKENQYVVCSAGQIVWLVGERSDDRFRVTEDTKRVLIIQQLWDK